MHLQIFTLLYNTFSKNEKAARTSNQTVDSRINLQSSPTALAFSVFYNTEKMPCIIFIKLPYPLYLHDHLSKGDTQLNARS